MTDEIRRYLDKANHALIVAEDLIGQGHAPDSASKIYYTMFYAAKALLAAEGIDVVKHSAVESAFGYYFAKPGRIDPRYHKVDGPGSITATFPVQFTKVPGLNVRLVA